MLNHKENENNVIELKKQLDSKLELLLDEIKKGKSQDIIIPLLNEQKIIFSRYLTAFEDFIVRVSENGYCRSKAEINDVLTSIENVLISSSFVAEAINTLSKNFDLPESYKQENFLKTSQIILKTHRKNKADELLEIYKRKSLSTNGFDCKDKIFLNRHGFDMARVVSFILGLVCIIYFLYEFKSGNINNGISWFNYRIFIPAGLGAIIFSLFPGSMKIKLAAGVTATGIAAFIIFFYLINPADVPNFDINKIENSSSNKSK